MLTGYYKVRTTPGLGDVPRQGGLSRGCEYAAGLAGRGGTALLRAATGRRGSSSACVLIAAPLVRFQRPYVTGAARTKDSSKKAYNGVAEDQSGEPPGGGIVQSIHAPPAGLLSNAVALPTLRPGPPKLKANPSQTTRRIRLPHLLGRSPRRSPPKVAARGPPRHPHLLAAPRPRTAPH